MKPSIHPDYKAMKFTCSCGYVLDSASTLGKDMSIEVCAQCHPFYTGKQKLVDTGGRVQKFRDRYSLRTSQ
jgi:large subunit ribosomal protein L31